MSSKWLSISFAKHKGIKVKPKTIQQSQNVFLSLLFFKARLLELNHRAQNDNNINKVKKSWSLKN
jgi:hypothetical protein